MSENNTILSGSDGKDTSDNTNLGRYFDPAVRTVFDEIVSPKTSDPAIVSSGEIGISEMNVMSELSSGDFFHDDNLLTAERVSDNVANDTHRDAWIASESTRKVLRSIATSTPGSNFPERENLTMPGLTIQSDMTDATKETAIHFLGEEENIHRNVLTASDVTQDERGLRNLIQAGCYRAAVNLSGRLIAIYGQGYGKINHPSKHTPHSLQLWYTRLSLLAKLKHFEVLRAESQPFGDLDKPDMYFTFYPELYGTRPGSMASFAFRLLLAEIPSYWGKPREAIDSLHKLLSTVEQLIKNLSSGLAEDGSPSKFSSSERQDSVRLWTGRRSRILISIVNCALTMKNFVLAIDVLEDLQAMNDWSKEQSEILRSAIGRVHLFLGDVSAAEKKFAVNKEDAGKTALTPRELIDRGLMAVAQNAFQEAFNCFKTASGLDPSNIMLVNNMAVCLLYTGQLKTAVQLLEKAVARNPLKSLQESVLLNMSTLYELHTIHCKQSKLHLLRQLNRYKGDAIDVQCLQLS
ncbi:trafficking protein particle complex subunit 12 [Venturia canescens]|uniref:trafficking protein particle complex subunit 12 n=1 Tax=Venturia canescens TaxID=32260 RepID=UPI001C9CA796|nr:trafficking protein particle complex subunit 12 [Venturia canescens]